MSLPPVLVTGFEPFGGDALNPSQQVALALAGEQIAGHAVRAVVLPCVFETALPALHAAIDALRPALVLALGLAGSRSAISIERVAVNLIDARIPDNAGAQPIDLPVIAGAPAAHFARLPLKAMLAGLQAAGLPVELSYSAGSFVCNQVFYGLMQRLQAWPETRGGFIHLPPLPEQAAGFPAATPLALAEQVRAVRLAAALALSDDGTAVAVSAGRLD